MLLKRAFPLILLPVAISHLQVAMAVVYIVGGPAGWDFAPTASYYSDWASENTFLPGDKLSKTLSLQSLSRDGVHIESFM